MLGCSGSLKLQRSIQLSNLVQLLMVFNCSQLIQRLTGGVWRAELACRPGALPTRHLCTIPSKAWQRKAVRVAGWVSLLGSESTL